MKLEVRWRACRAGKDMQRLTSILMRSILRLLVGALFLLVVLASAPEYAKAQSGPQSVTSYQFNNRRSYAENNGFAGQQIYIAWAAGNAHSCLTSDYPAEHAGQRVLQLCESSVSPLRSRFALTAPIPSSQLSKPSGKELRAY
jgi:hypothetical protein